MSEKSKYLLKIGVFWAILMAVISTGLEAWSKGNFSVFLSWLFVAKLLVFFLVGIGVGYFNWKATQKSAANNP